MGYLCQQFDDANNREVNALNRIIDLETSTPIMVGESGGSVYVHEFTGLGWIGFDDVEAYSHEDVANEHAGNSLYTLEQLKQDVDLVKPLLKEIIQNAERTGQRLEGEEYELYAKLAHHDVQDKIADASHRIEEIKKDMDEHGYEVERAPTGECNM